MKKYLCLYLIISIISLVSLVAYAGKSNPVQYRYTTELSNGMIITQIEDSNIDYVNSMIDTLETGNIVNIEVDILK